MSKSVSRVLSWMIIYLGHLLPNSSSDTTREHIGPMHFSSPIWSCSRWGLHSHTVASVLVSSYLAFPPLPLNNLIFSGGISLLHFPWSHLHRGLPGTLPYGARTFLSPLTGAAITQLTQFIYLFLALISITSIIIIVKW